MVNLVTCHITKCGSFSSNEWTLPLGLITQPSNIEKTPNAVLEKCDNSWIMAAAQIHYKFYQGPVSTLRSVGYISWPQTHLWQEQHLVSKATWPARVRRFACSTGKKKNTATPPTTVRQPCLSWTVQVVNKKLWTPTLQSLLKIIQKSSEDYGTAEDWIHRHQWLPTPPWWTMQPATKCDVWPGTQLPRDVKIPWSHEQLTSIDQTCIMWRLSIVIHHWVVKFQAPRVAAACRAAVNMAKLLNFREPRDLSRCICKCKYTYPGGL